MILVTEFGGRVIDIISWDEKKTKKLFGKTMCRSKLNFSMVAREASFLLKPRSLSEIP